MFPTILLFFRYVNKSHCEGRFDLNSHEQLHVLFFFVQETY